MDAHLHGALPPLGDRLHREGGDAVELGRVDEVVDRLRDVGQELPAAAASVAVVVVVVGDGGSRGEQTEQADADQRHQQDGSDQAQAAASAAALLWDTGTERRSHSTLRRPTVRSRGRNNWPIPNDRFDTVLALG